MNLRHSPDPSEIQRRHIQIWRSWHGVIILTATGLALFVNIPVLVSCAALLSLLALGKLGSVPQKTDAGINYANRVTVGRILLGATLIFTPGYLGPVYAASQLVVLWILDGLDGYLARSFNTVSILGANLDKEGDAFITLAACLALMQIGMVGPWVLAIGLMRYAYLSLLGLTRRVSKSPPSPFSKFTTGYTQLMLALSFVIVSDLHTSLLIIAAILTFISYCRAVYHAFR